MEALVKRQLPTIAEPLAGEFPERRGPLPGIPSRQYDRDVSGGVEVLESKSAIAWKQREGLQAIVDAEPTRERLLPLELLGSELADSNRAPRNRSQGETRSSGKRRDLMQEHPPGDARHEGLDRIAQVGSAFRGRPKEDNGGCILRSGGRKRQKHR